jgi:hypothetical protein
MAASTLGDIMVTPSVDWEAFAKEWIALGQEMKENTGGEVDDLADAFDNWGKGSTLQENRGMEE